MSSSSHAISVHLDHTLLVSGCPVEGAVELNFRDLQENGIQEVHLKLRGIIRTENVSNSPTGIKTIELARDDASIWCLGGAYPMPGSDTLRIPFRLQLPSDVPPSFHYDRHSRKGAIRYAITAVGTRSGALHLNRRARVSLAVVPKDAMGVGIREKFALMAATGTDTEWRTERREEKMRRGLWGDYATAQVELQVPKTSVFPLYVPIPFVIKIRTSSPPLTRAKADAHPPGEPVFPQVPTTYSAIQLKLHRKVFIKATSLRDKVPSDVVVSFKPHGDPDSVLIENVPPLRWVSLGDSNGEKNKNTGGDSDANAMGTWVQEAAFRSTFHLDCPPTFTSDLMKCDYELVLKVPFLGVGNDVSLVMPITVTSGIDAPMNRDQPDSVSGPLDLPPAYWDAGDHEWEEDLKA
ncbi:hypothetical protein TRAPUB_13177 [Trametes pubescens]|uniref:Arrestin-like N-terminal domain-containing protein n=1 Tax=Trametes pubescens TaxID=154538 RepID=A0A1M2VRS0_TRAPU|nr:hypothetical protein TRAPUB_13177 [Trametes pubescens]